VAANCVAVKHVESRNPGVFGTYPASAFFKTLFVFNKEYKGEEKMMVSFCAQ